MRRWWREKDFSSVLREQAITCEMDTDSIVEKIYSDLNADRKAIAFMSIESKCNTSMFRLAE